MVLLGKTIRIYLRMVADRLSARGKAIINQIKGLLLRIGWKFFYFIIQKSLRKLVYNRNSSEERGRE